MNRFIIIIISILSFGLASCKSDLQEEDYLFNDFFVAVDPNNAVSIDSISIIDYNVHPISHDTVLVKFLVNYRISDKLFEENNLLKPKFSVVAELYINNIEYPILYEGTTKKINVYKGFDLFKDKENLMYFKLVLLNNEDKRVACSDTLRFRVN